MRRVIGSFAVCFAIAALSGCGPVIWQRFTLNQPITKDQVAFIQNGETQLSEVARELGSPDEILNLKNRLIARYHFIDTKYFRINFGWGLRFFIPYYTPDLVLSGGGAGTDVFDVACDSKFDDVLSARLVHHGTCERSGRTALTSP
jgi:hypothetical protein